jgi:hypothetical protein
VVRLLIADPVFEAKTQLGIAERGFFLRALSEY